jgi:VIT1/CCC1 family predicted Fe2+/Mn2+ transporter
MLSEKNKKIILQAQKNEITEFYVYNNLAASNKADLPAGRQVINRDVLKKIADDEMEHYNFWKKITGVDLKPDKLKIFRFGIISKIFGITFATKLMEAGEVQAQASYGIISGFAPEGRFIIEDEGKHERELVELIEEERLKYVSSMVLGLNDALVELTGTLAGFSLVFQKTKVIAVAGLVTGIAGALSMAGSEYLSQKSEEDESRSPLRASVYTGIVYIFTVIILIAPYLIFQNPFLCIAIVIASVVLIIWVFTFYISVATDKPFGERFVEMVLISFGVALLSFGFGYAVRVLFNIEV